MTDREYVVRIVNDTGGASEQVSAQPSTAKGEDFAEAAQSNAKSAKTSVYVNAAMRVGMPVFNALSDGAVGEAYSAVNKVMNFVGAIGAGASMGGLIGAGAALLGWGVSEAVNAIQTEKRQNEAELRQLRETNILRLMSGLDAIPYSVGFLGKISYGGTRL